MLNDLFSHKIHASKDIEGWERTLVKVAEVFLDFDKQIFDKPRLNERFYELAPNTKPGRDPFRDIFSIYMAIFGVGHIVLEEGIWKVRISETARRYLIGTEPNVDIYVTPQEIYTLVNCEDLRSKPSPSFEDVTEALKRYNNQELQKPTNSRKCGFGNCFTTVTR